MPIQKQTKLAEAIEKCGALEGWKFAVSQGAMTHDAISIAYTQPVAPKTLAALADRRGFWADPDEDVVGSNCGAGPVIMGIMEDACRAASTQELAPTRQTP